MAYRPELDAIRSVAVVVYLPLIVLGLVALILVGPMLSAQLGPIDDHEVPVLTRDVAAKGAVAAILTLPTETRRFRPAYWLIRRTEAAVWGMNAAGWYLDRLLLAATTMFLAWAIARRFVRPILALPLAALSVAGPQAEAWFRLGPQESIATPLLLVGALARGPAGVVALVAAGLTKETFLPFALAALWLHRGQPRMAFAGALALIAAGILAIPRGAGYAATWSLADLLSQGRYYAPVVLAGIGAIALWGNRRPRLQPTLAAALSVLVVVAVATERPIANAWKLRAAAWQADIAEIRVELERNPGAVLIVSPETSADYEPAFSLRAFLTEGTAMIAPGWFAMPPALAEDLERAVTEGLRGYAPFAPGPCVEAAFGVPRGGCAAVVQF